MNVHRFEFLVEEPSMETALRILLPAIVPGILFEIRTFNGKSDLLRKLPGRLKGYRTWAGAANAAIVVLVDRDDDDCVTLKSRLDLIATVEGLTVHSASAGSAGQVLNRLAIEELEAWFLGDIPALVAAYPRIPKTFAHRRGLRDPDAIHGGTWETLERILQRAGHHRGGLGKITAARDIAQHMQVDTNRSDSFARFRDGVRSLVGGVTVA